MKPLDTSPVTSYRRARKKHGIPRWRALRLTAEDTLLQLRSWRMHHTWFGGSRAHR